LPGPPASSPLVSVLLVTYNSVNDLDRCLSALQRQKVAGSYELLVVDNASTDGSADAVEAWRAKARPKFSVTLIRNETNVGYAEANNQAAGQAQGRILLLLNPDAVMDDGAMAALVDHLAGSPGVGVAAAVLRNPDETPQEFARRDVSVSGVVWDLTFLGRRFDQRWRDDRGRRRRRYADEWQAADEPLDVDCPAAACVALWRELAGRHLFDERLPLFFNDAELFGRIRDRGYRCQVVPTATAVHGYGTSHRQIDIERKRAEFVASLRRYASLRLPMRTSALITLVLFADTLSAFADGAWPGRKSVRRHARGTLGGLWLPGGATPWLTRRPTTIERFRMTRARLGQAVRDGADGMGRRRRRRRLMRAIRWQSWLLKAPVDVRIDRSADIGSGMRLELKYRRPASLVVGPRAVINDGVLLRLWGGRLVVGSGALVRHGASLTVKGLLDIAPRANVSRDAQLHADGTMRIGFGVTVAERVTVVDTTHTFDDVPTQIFDKPVTQADVTLEPCCFVGAGSTVNPGVTIGRSAVVGALSVVTRDVPECMLVAGSPAEPVRPVTSLLTRAAVPRTSAGPPMTTAPHQSLGDRSAAPAPAPRRRRSSPASPG
jgi:GT2 family glycosyltransferase/carbonic anhydrase/acetyltransferase-like protein (isoleucine patch superfamily)